MRTRRLLLAALGAVGAVAATAALAAGGESAPVASATAGSNWDIPLRFCDDLHVHLPFNARLHADGSVDGHWTYRNDCQHNDAGWANGPVTCLTIRGNHAWVGGVITSTNVDIWLGREMWFQVIDNGEPNSDENPDVSTLIGTSTVPGSAQAYCDGAPQPRLPWLVSNGNIQVRDLR